MASATHPSGITHGDHVVQFYAGAADLVDGVGRYLLDAAQRASVSVVIATAEHRDAFVRHLSSRGVDAAAAEREGTLVLLDAEATLARFTVDGRIERAAFFEVIGGVVREAAATGRPVRAYGEMVALLWDAGDVLAAIELETLWNELALELPFSLYCAYHSDSVEGHAHAAALHDVCRLHSAVLPDSAGDVVAEFPAERSAAVDARRLVSQALRSWGHGPAVVADAEVVVTELAANAVLHARTPFTVLVQRCGPLARIAVRDRATGMPVISEPDPARLSGRGMHLVNVMSLRWGVEVDGDDKTVWAELGGWSRG